VVSKGAMARPSIHERRDCRRRRGKEQKEWIHRHSNRFSFRCFDAANPRNFHVTHLGSEYDSPNNKFMLFITIKSYLEVLDWLSFLLAKSTATCFVLTFAL
jgi:hypothetical protein